MTPYDTYRLYQVERAKSPREIQRAGEQAARLASAVSWLFHGITRACAGHTPQPGPTVHPARQNRPAAGER